MNSQPQRQAFVSRLQEDPYDQVTRLVYADWLEEFGDCPEDDEEASRQRAWDPAEYRASEEWLEDYVQRINAEDDDHEGGGGLTLEEVLLAAHAHLDDPDGYEGSVCLWHQTPDLIYDEARDFWRHFEIYAMRRVDKLRQRDTFFRCAC
jgi:uncharacterized protein (TIGR02996 family)